MALMRSVGVRLRMWVDQYKRDAEQAKRANDELRESGKRAKGDLDQLTGTMTILGGAMVAAAGAVIYTTARFDKSMSEVKAVSGATADEFERLRQAALDAGASTVFSASESANAMGELAKAGVVVDDILGGALLGTLDLAAAGTLDLAEAAEIAAKTMNTFGLRGKDVGHIADVLAAAANKSATSVQELGVGLQQVGLVANQVGFSMEETVGLLAAFADRGLAGSDGATSLKTALLRLAAPIGEAAELMELYGISLYDANGNMVDAITIAGQLQTGLKDLSAAERNAALNVIFGQDAIRAANVLYGLGAEGLRDYIDAVDDQGAAARVAGEKLNNLAGDVQLLQSALEGLFIKSGSGVSGGLRMLTQGITEVVGVISGLPSPIQTAGVVILGLTGTLLLGGAAAIKARSAIAAMNATLIATGPAGAKAAAGIRVATAALGGIGIAIAAIATATEILDRATGRGGVDTMGRIITPRAVGELAARLEVVGKSITETADLVDQELARMAQAGRSAEAMALVERAAQTSGKSVEQLLAQLPDFAAAMSVAGTVTSEQAAAAMDAAQRNIALAGAFGEAANEADGLKNAFAGLNGTMLGWREAERDAEAAVDDLVDALKESNGSLDVTDKKGRDASAAVDGLAIAAIEAAQAKYDETRSVEEANAVYQKYIDQLKQILINAGHSEESVNKLVDQIAAMPTYKAITVEVDYRLSAKAQGIGGLAAFSVMAEGGVVRAARGRLQPTVVSSPTVLFGERGTGEEAFIPRKGVSASRAMSILQQAAGWYDAAVVPRGMASPGGMSMVDVRVSLEPGADTPLMRAIEDRLRVEVVQVGGGSVQGRYGARGRVG